MSFVNKNPFFSEFIRDEFEKAGFKEVGEITDDTPTKIHYCDISYGKRNHPNTKK
jgi:hypothetical protein